jgi:phosphodiesterase/alkaline phosphatase D-like protein
MHKTNLLYIIALLVVLWPGRAAAQNYADSTIVYLEWVSDPTRTMVINWIEADTTGIAVVYYRVRNSGLPWTMSAGEVTQIPDATVKRKSVRLTGLTPGTEYGFRLGDSLSTKSHYFRTMPANLSNPVRFIVSGDVYGDGTDPVQETANFIESAGVARQLDPHFAIFAGDLIHLNEANEYNATSLNRFFKMLSEYTKYMRTPGGHYIPLVAGLGNHELPQRFGGQPSDAKHFNALFNFPGNRGYNTLDFGDYLSLIMLNTDHTARIEGAQTDWLEAQLSARRNVVNVFPVYHVAAYPGKRPFVPGRGYEVRQYWSPLFDRYNVRFAFEHDNHGYKRTEPLRADSPHPCGVRYIGEGGFAIPLGPVDTTYDYLEQQWNVRHIVNVELTQTSRRIQTFASSTGFLIDVHSQNTRIAPPGIQLATNIQANSFTANWNPNCNADGYRLDVSTDPNFATFVTGYQNRNVGDNYSLNITGLTPLTTYYYRVRAVNSFLNQTSGNSNTLELTTSSLPPNVNAATNITAGSFTASWDAIQGADQYALDVSTSSNFSSFLSGFENRNVGNNLSFQVTGLQPATPYYYRVRARSSLGNQSSANSTVVGLNTLTQPPILSEATQISSTGFQINWTQVVRADQYVVDVSSDSTFTTFLSGYNNRSVGNNSSVSVTGLAPLTQYFYRVRSRNTTLNVTSFNSTLGRTVTPSSPPLARNAINVTTSGFTARWQSVQGVNRYYFDLATDAAFENFVVGFENYNAGNVTSIDLADLESAQVYYYRVRASNSSTNLTSENSTSIRVVTIPDEPGTLPATQVTPRSFVANWSEVQRVDTYLLDVSTDSQFTSFIPDYQNRAYRNSTSAEVIELSPNRVYYYRVRASQVENEVTGSYSNVSSISTILDAPESLTLVSIGTNEALVSWSQAENATEYFIDVARDVQFNNLLSSYTDLSVGTVTQIRIEGLESVESYYVRVRAGGQEDEVTSTYSEPIQFTTIPVTPELSEAAAIRAVGFTANWSEVGKATDYELEVAYNETFTQSFENFSPLNVGDVTTYVFTGVLPNTVLFFRVRAVNNTFNVVSEWSEVRSVTTVAIDPILSTVEVSQTSILANGTDSGVFTITIKDAQGNPLDGVSVQLIADSGDSVIQAIQDTSDDSGITRFRITNNKAEFVRYRVRAIQTDLDTETEIAFTPVAPTALTATNVVASSLTVNWSLVNGATSYRLDVSENASFSSYLDGMQDREVEAATRFELSGLYPGNAYFYRVRAVAPTGTSLNSNVVNVVTPQADPNLTAVELTQRSILADGASSVDISVLVRGSDGQPMSGVPVRLETEDVNSVVTTINGVSDQNGLTLFKTSSDFAGSVSYTVFAGRVQINTPAVVNRFAINTVVLLWQSVQGVNRYYFDLATDANFEQFVAGFENYNAGNVTSIDLADLESFEFIERSNQCKLQYDQSCYQSGCS